MREKHKRHIQYMKDMVWSLNEAIDYASQYEMLSNKQQQGEEVDVRQLRLEQRSMERAFEIAGEAANRVRAEIQEKYPEIVWRKITDLRNVISHEYDGIKEKILLRIAKEDAPQVLLALEKAIKQEITFFSKES
ncbi:MAG: DUF86 domain-containing protein [Spirochaetaceae bacterium]|nr:DUF86 domain-containing protein [Spirochaetaceae bacterium]